MTDVQVYSNPETYAGFPAMYRSRDELILKFRGPTPYSSEGKRDSSPLGTASDTALRRFEGRRPHLADLDQPSGDRSDSRGLSPDGHAEPASF